MIFTIDDLGEALTKMQDTKINNTYKASDGLTYFINDEDLDLAASGLLMSKLWRPNWSAIKDFESKFRDFKVTGGDTDSFGWLTGVIITPKARFTFG